MKIGLKTDYWSKTNQEKVITLLKQVGWIVGGSWLASILGIPYAFQVGGALIAVLLLLLFLSYLKTETQTKVEK